MYLNLYCNTCIIEIYVPLSDAIVICCVCILTLFIIIQLITLRQLKCSYLSNCHHQPGEFFRTGLLWHSTAADGLLHGGDGTVPTSVVFAPPPPLGATEVGTVPSPPCSNPSAAVLCHNKPVLKNSPGWWWKFDKYEHFNCLSVMNCIIMNFYQTNEPLHEYSDTAIAIRRAIRSYLIGFQHALENG